MAYRKCIVKQISFYKGFIIQLIEIDVIISS